MSKNAKSSDSNKRRAAVKKLMAGAGVVAGGHALTDNWIRPVISTAMIPVHAGTSCIPDVSIGEVEVEGDVVCVEVVNDSPIGFEATLDAVNSFDGENGSSTDPVSPNESINLCVPFENFIEVANIEVLAEGSICDLETESREFSSDPT